VVIKIKGDLAKLVLNRFRFNTLVGQKKYTGPWSLSDILYELVAYDNAEEKDCWK
jgi:hypothetical protein